MTMPVNAVSPSVTTTPSSHWIVTKKCFNVSIILFEPRFNVLVKLNPLPQVRHSEQMVVVVPRYERDTPVQPFPKSIDLLTLLVRMEPEVPEMIYLRPLLFNHRIPILNHNLIHLLHTGELWACLPPEIIVIEMGVSREKHYLPFIVFSIMDSLSHCDCFHSVPAQVQVFFSRKRSILATRSSRAGGS